jgi:hypothetical protein
VADEFTLPLDAPTIVPVATMAGLWFVIRLVSAYRNLTRDSTDDNASLRREMADDRERWRAELAEVKADSRAEMHAVRQAHEACESRERERLTTEGQIREALGELRAEVRSLAARDV